MTLPKSNIPTNLFAILSFSFVASGELDVGSLVSLSLSADTLAQTAAIAPEPDVLMSFTDFADDIQFNILSFLSPAEISAFACTCRRFAALCSPFSPSADLWFALCHRRWGSKTDLRRWTAAPSPRLYKIFDRWENLIGFWRLIGSGTSATPPLLFFEWGPSSITGSHVSPSPSSYAVQKIPFLWLGLSSAGDTLTYLHPANPVSDSDVIPVTISFMGRNHFVIEDSSRFCPDPLLDDPEEVLGLHLETGSPPDRLMSEIYQYFANRTSSGGEKSSRRQRKKERLGRRWVTEHFVKIPDSCPTPARPLQGLWKGISENMSLDFYLVVYDDVGGITCRRVGYVGEPLSAYSLVFWTLNTPYLESPFSKEEHVIYSLREHVRPVGSDKCNMEREVVSRILCISSYDLVFPNLAGSPGDPINVEGRIWEYEDGTFGFGFLRSNFIVDFKHIALNGYLLDSIEHYHQRSI